jgi:hypothetical protein
VVGEKARVEAKCAAVRLHETAGTLGRGEAALAVCRYESPRVVANGQSQQAKDVGCDGGFQTAQPRSSVPRSHPAEVGEGTIPVVGNCVHESS